MTDSLLTARELGDYLGLTAGTVLDRFEAGDLPGYRLFGKKGGPVRFRLDEIEAWLNACRVNTTAAEPSFSEGELVTPAQLLASGTPQMACLGVPKS